MATPQIAAAMKGATISTFGGNPVATTAAKAVLELIEQENLTVNAAETGAYLRANLEELKGKHALIGEVRGMGLMQAVELVQDRESKTPATQETLRLMEAARENRILLGRGGLYGNVLRISPPLNITKHDVDDFIRQLDLSFASVTEPATAGSAR
jgi:4-aminobutyrate aminotransferase-like enzyme